MEGKVANEALLVPLNDHCPEPVVPVLLPKVDLVLLSREHMPNKPCVVHLQQIGVVLEHVLDDASGDNAVGGQA